jgi:hypothetical protein
MSMRHMFSPRTGKKTRSKRSGQGKSSLALGDEGFGDSKARPRIDLRLAVQRQFMRMMETHDLMRARVLRSSPTTTYPVSGD